MADNGGKKNDEGAAPAGGDGGGATPAGAARPGRGDGGDGGSRAETVAPARYRTGQKAPSTLYGVRGPDGSVKATGGGGTEEPAPGARGVVLAAEGTVLNASTVRLLNDNDEA